MAMILNMWDTLISTTLNPSKANLSALTDESTQSIIGQSAEEQERVKSLLIESIIDKPKIRDKQQFVQVNQAILIRLLDKLHVYKQGEGINEKIINLYNSISEHLENSLSFIEDFFGNYFDRNEKVPLSYLTVSIEELCRQLEKLKKVVTSNGKLNSNLTNIIIDNFNHFCTNLSKGVTYNELMYQKDLMNELLTDNTLDSEQSIKEVLFYFNFNDDDYIAYLYQQLASTTESLNSKVEKIAALRYEQKSINQLTTRLTAQLTSNMPSLKEQVNQWIEEEIKFLETEQAFLKPAKPDIELEDKIQTSLSVAKLALLIRLMILDKIILNRVVAHALRMVVKIFSTAHQENISFGSLETKYHNPDRGTISAVKDMLFRWINILSKL